MGTLHCPPRFSVNLVYLQQCIQRTVASGAVLSRLGEPSAWHFAVQRLYNHGSHLKVCMQNCKLRRNTHLLFRGVETLSTHVNSWRQKASHLPFGWEITCSHCGWGSRGGWRPSSLARIQGPRGKGPSPKPYRTSPGDRGSAVPWTLRPQTGGVLSVSNYNKLFVLARKDSSLF